MANHPSSHDASYSLQQELSDKVYWHGYVPFYEQFFQDRSFKNIAEFGVFQGNSIRWFLKRFPNAKIYGADILTLQSNWPVDERFHFTQLDQGNQEQVRKFLHQADFDLILEDGSHFPHHQVSCLIEGLKVLRSGGMYILEDIQTARKDHAWWNESIHFWKLLKKLRYQKFVSSQQLDHGNALHALLAIQHYQRIGKVVDDQTIEKIAQKSIFRPEDIAFLFESIDQIHFYQRSNLPDFCHKCGSVDYQFSDLKCQCGEAIFSDADSMAFVILKK
jgi:hypothetical protein